MIFIWSIPCCLTLTIWHTWSSSIWSTSKCFRSYPIGRYIILLGGREEYLFSNEIYASMPKAVCWKCILVLWFCGIGEFTVFIYEKNKKRRARHKCSITNSERMLNSFINYQHDLEMFDDVVCMSFNAHETLNLLIKILSKGATLILCVEFERSKGLASGE